MVETLGDRCHQSPLRLRMLYGTIRTSRSSLRLRDKSAGSEVAGSRSSCSRWTICASFPHFVPIHVAYMQRTSVKAR